MKTKLECMIEFLRRINKLGLKPNQSEAVIDAVIDFLKDMEKPTMKFKELKGGNRQDEKNKSKT